MQVKKFEARSMKEALEMIKTQLGPDAIILSAKEITKGFGLGGEKSIEVTAAYSEAILQKKKFTESKMSPQTLEKFQRIGAKEQKEVMRKAVEAQIAKMNAQAAPVRSAAPASASTASSSNVPYRMTEKRYVDIDNEEIAQSAPSQSINANMHTTEVAKKAWNDMEVSTLKQEIETLKQVMTQFKNVPQSFVHAHPGADYGVHFQMSPHYQKLTQAGILPEIAGEMIRGCQSHLSAQQMQSRSIVENIIVKYILDTIKVNHTCDEQFHLFVGPSGSGKTSSLIKLASEMILNQQKRVAIISTDNTKVGGAEQMKMFAQILNVPFLSIRNQQDWAHVIPHLDQLDHVLVDYSGLNLRNQDEINFIKRMSPPVYRSMRVHLVLSSLAKDADLRECAKRYEAFGYNDVIFSGLDEAAQHGNIFNFVKATKTELFAFGIGSKVPEDFEFASAERVIDLILKITQNKKQEATA
ncbi:MAG: flagellar biosynthesis protein FlhF [Pseudobdellovibrio sp.]